ncbi:hypothetical protein EDEG_02397 [Edhazardia aedis USNM 41457]|uniref:Uncharacterized protein n=1 Tax=Edhazardia aedis (strain USNM 41457) TaxID=1003232 RepID=J9D6T2_EDHAE|nr:hypothetical protein EDEG_02397 [Edhazardia aedis USNM 41457]|eukprot:EJW03229.1 hypothetical protein EDEG_02397 [Edhazardia aedis USNM 41457]
MKQGSKFPVRNWPTFSRGMSEKNIKIVFFMLEGMVGFENRTTCGKMTEVAMRGSDKLKEWYYEAGASDELPETWSDFIQKVIEFCTERDISHLKKYHDES